MNINFFSSGYEKSLSRCYLLVDYLLVTKSVLKFLVESGVSNLLTTIGMLKGHKTIKLVALKYFIAKCMYFIMRTEI